jgi:hypothetical protein
MTPSANRIHRTRLLGSRRTRWALGTGLAVLAATTAVRARAPVDQYAIFDRSAPVVRDRFTGLTWQRVVADARFKFGDASTYCVTLSLDGGGFRLPTRAELVTLVDDDVHTVFVAGRIETRAIDPNAFPDTPPAAFWTSDAVTGQPDTRWSVEFAVGESGTDNEATLLAVRCVKGP